MTDEHTQLGPTDSRAERRRVLWTAEAGFVLLAGLLVFSGAVRPALAAAPTTGEQIWQTKCANCHGPQGEGIAKRTHRLEGDKSPAQLADVIRETMPEDDPGSLSTDESQRVAAWLHEAFYSRNARERNASVRVELARLTARQYRQTVSDLIGSFRGSPWWGEERGLRGTYMNGRNPWGEAALKRVDPQVNFQFGTDAPAPEITEPREFSIRWNGSVLARDTGEYEFVVRTEHALRLWINNSRQPLIDAWVKSGADTEYRGTCYLIGGRMYSLRLDFTKGKQGVDDSKEKKEKAPASPASIVLLWKSPSHPLEPIPTRNLSTQGAPDEFVCTTPFPPDDRSYGWIRGTAVSKEWDDATTAAAFEVTAYLTAHLREFAGKENGELDAEKLRAFCRMLAERAFRRPLNSELAEPLIDRQLAATADLESGFKRVCLLIFKSPRFLYREIGGDNDQYDVAARLSYGIWDSLPDQELWNAVAAGKLATPEQIREQAWRMFSDQRARSKLREFLFTWLKAEGHLDLTKDAKKFPGFDEQSIADLRTSLELFLDDVLNSEGADFRRLLLEEQMFVNGRLGKLYGLSVPDENVFQRVALPPDRHAGVLTHPYVMAAFAHAAESSPIHRGVFLARGVLGQTLKPPPEAVAPLAADLHPDLTTRERVILQTNHAACMTCHGVINPLGFPLERFDAIGRYRESDREKPIDATGHYRNRDGQTITVDGARELARFLVASEETHLAFTEQLLHHLVQQSAAAYGPETLSRLRTEFAENEFNIRQLAVETMVATAGVGRPSPAASSTAPSK